MVSLNFCEIVAIITGLWIIIFITTRYLKNRQKDYEDIELEVELARDKEDNKIIYKGKPRNTIHKKNPKQKTITIKKGRKTKKVKI